MHKDDEKQALTEAFAAFNAHSMALHQSYESLQKRMADMAEALRESRAAEQAGRAKNMELATRLSGLIEALPAAVVEVQSDGAVTAANAMALQLFGSDLNGQIWPDVTARYVIDLSGKAAWSHAGRCFSIAKSICRNGNALFVFTDITEAEQSRERNERQSRLAMLGEMAARTAHQIRTPLATAMLYATNTQSGDLARARIVSRLRELEAMVDDMLLFARGTPPADDFLNSTELLERVVEDASALAPSHVRIVSRPTPGGFTIRGNQRALIGALQNLVVNAAQHCNDDNGLVELADRIDEDGRLCIDVRDNGSGIGAELKAQIFEPFFTTRPDGTGLGLAVVRSVAHAHDGDVTCQSEADGTVFSLRLPTDLPASRAEAFTFAEYAHG